MSEEIIREPVCFQCRHFFFFPFCAAFPDGIPVKIRVGENDHSAPFPGDHGIQFRPVEGQPSGTTE